MLVEQIAAKSQFIANKLYLILSSYRLRLGNYSGTIGEESGLGLSYSIDKPFTTLDKDNDDSAQNCAVRHQGAWWYRSCHRSNLNGRWADQSDKGVNWSGRESTWVYPTFTEMKIRRLS